MDSVAAELVYNGTDPDLFTPASAPEQSANNFDRRKSLGGKRA